MINPSPPVFSAAEFRKATLSEPSANCVEIARRDGWVEVRDDKLKGTPYYNVVVLRLPEIKFDVYQAAVRNGASTASLHLAVTRRADSNYEFRVAETDTVLLFDQSEVDAFHDGVVKHEFDVLVSA